MPETRITRRQFIGRTAAIAGGVALAGCSGPAPQGGAPAPAAKRTAADRVVLGKSGVSPSRLGIGVGSNGGNVQRALGHEAFDRLIRHAYDRGVTYIDTADSYHTHDWVRQAIAGLPREKLYIQSKMGGVPPHPLEDIDRFRKELGVDYIDTVLVHCAFTANWDQERKPVIDALLEAKARKIVRAVGFSCHSLTALARAAQLDWIDVALLRMNPQGSHIDTPIENWDAPSDASHVEASLAGIRAIKAKGIGIIGMKICGNGDFTDAGDREKSIRFAMTSGLPDAIVIGLKSPAEVDEAIERIDRNLAG